MTNANALRPIEPVLEQRLSPIVGLDPVHTLPPSLIHHSQLVTTAYHCGYAGRPTNILGGLENMALRFCSNFVEQRRRPPNYMDVGCGDGSLATQLVSRGAFVTVVDRENNLGAAAQELCAQGAIKPIIKPAELIYPMEVPRELNGFTCLRALHWLTYKHAKGMLTRIGSNMPRGAPLLISVAGLDSPLSKGYPFNAKTPLRMRHAIPTGANAHFQSPVTLYTANEAVQLIEESGFDVKSVRVTDWGLCNVRAHRSDTPNMGRRFMPGARF